MKQMLGLPVGIKLYVWLERWVEMDTFYILV